MWLKREEGKREKRKKEKKSKKEEGIKNETLAARTEFKTTAKQKKGKVMEEEVNK